MPAFLSQPANNTLIFVLQVGISLASLKTSIKPKSKCLVSVKVIIISHGGLIRSRAYMPKQLISSLVFAAQMNYKLKSTLSAGSCKVMTKSLYNPV